MRRFRRGGRARFGQPEPEGAERSVAAPGPSGHSSAFRAHRKGPRLLTALAPTLNLRALRETWPAPPGCEPGHTIREGGVSMGMTDSIADRRLRAMQGGWRLPPADRRRSRRRATGHAAGGGVWRDRRE